MSRIEVEGVLGRQAHESLVSRLLRPDKGNLDACGNGTRRRLQKLQLRLQNLRFARRGWRLSTFTYASALRYRTSPCLLEPRCIAVRLSGRSARGASVSAPGGRRRAAQDRDAGAHRQRDGLRIAGRDARLLGSVSASPGRGRVPAWGYGVVVASQGSELQAGARYFGLFPMSSFLVVGGARGTRSGFADGQSHRQALNPVYNQYFEAQRKTLSSVRTMCSSVPCS